MNNSCSKLGHIMGEEKQVELKNGNIFHFPVFCPRCHMLISEGTLEMQINVDGETLNIFIRTGETITRGGRENASNQ
jgi:hypothetical protein